MAGPHLGKAVHVNGSRLNYILIAFMKIHIFGRYIFYVSFVTYMYLVMYVFVRGFFLQQKKKMFVTAAAVHTHTHTHTHTPPPVN